MNNHYKLCCIIQYMCLKGADHRNWNEDRPILSAAKNVARVLCGFRQHKVYVDICILQGSMQRLHQKTVMVIKNTIICIISAF